MLKYKSISCTLNTPCINITKMSAWKARTMRESKLEELRTSLKSGKKVKVEKKYFVSLPTEEAHHQTHPTGGMHGMAQKVHPQVAEKIKELVSEGITDTSSVSRMLRHYVNHHLCQEEKPNPSDRAYYPTKDDIKNHVYQAKQALQLSKLDQKNLELKLPKWKSQHPDSHILFRPFKLKESANEEKKHEVSPEDREKLLELLRACAHAPPATEEGVPVNQFYKAAESALKESDLFKENPHIRYWLLNMWLNKPQVCKHGCVFAWKQL